jgi:hypothetical protein
MVSICGLGPWDVGSNPAFSTKMVGNPVNWEIKWLCQPTVFIIG